MNTTSQTEIATKTASLSRCAEPQIVVRFPRGTSHRVVKAELHKLAAAAEAATPENESWCINIEAFNEGGYLHLELTTATPEEAERGLAMLNKILG